MRSLTFFLALVLLMSRCTIYKGALIPTTKEMIEERVNLGDRVKVQTLQGKIYRFTIVEFDEFHLVGLRSGKEYNVRYSNILAIEVYDKKNTRIGPITAGVLLGLMAVFVVLGVTFAI